MTYWWQNIFLVGNMIHTQDQIYQVSSAPLTGEKKKKKAYEVVNLHAVFSRWDIPNMKREQSMTGYETPPWIHPLCLQQTKAQKDDVTEHISSHPLKRFHVFWKHMLGWFSKMIIWGHHLTALILQRLRNGQRETEDVSLDAANHWRESVRHVVIYTLAGSNITRGEESLPRHDKHTFIIKVY